MLSVCVFLLFLLVPLPAAQVAKPTAAPDPWVPVRFMIGTWRGPSKGDPGQGMTDRTYQFEFGETFIAVRNTSAWTPTTQFPKGETHQDTGFISYDKARKRLVLRQFHSEGFVNQYVFDPAASDARTLVFVTEAIENIPAGWRARETYRIVGPDEFTENFDLAEPGKDFAPYSECRLKRVK